MINIQMLPADSMPQLGDYQTRQIGKKTLYMAAVGVFRAEGFLNMKERTALTSVFVDGGLDIVLTERHEAARYRQASPPGLVLITQSRPTGRSVQVHFDRESVYTFTEPMDKKIIVEGCLMMALLVEGLGYPEMINSFDPRYKPAYDSIDQQSYSRSEAGMPENATACWVGRHKPGAWTIKNAVAEGDHEQLDKLFLSGSGLNARQRRLTNNQ